MGKGFWAIYFLFFVAPLYGQVKTKEPTKVIVSMKNGEVYRGLLLGKDSTGVLLSIENGELKLLADKIAKLDTALATERFDFVNPHASRYFFAPGALPLDKKSGYYQNVLLIGNFFNYGLTRHLSIGGGFEFVSTIAGVPIWFLTPKVGFQVRKDLHLGGGVLVAGVGDEGVFSIGYGLITRGTKDTNFSIGIGHGISLSGLSPNPVVMLGGMHRLRNGLGLLSENFIVPSTNNNNWGYLGIHGFRLMSRKNAFDIGAVIIPSIADVIPALPYAGYVRKF